MVGGRIIENALHTYTDDGETFTRRRLWVADRNGDECAVFVEEAGAQLRCGEEIWWQAGTIYARGDTLTLQKIGFSHQPA